MPAEAKVREAGARVREAEAKVREVAPGIYEIYLPLPTRPTIVNIYLVKSGEEWALIDTGMSSDDSIATFKAALDIVGCSPSSIRKLISTHHHPDHFGTSRTYKELTGAEIYLNTLEVERVKRMLTFTGTPPEALDFFRLHGVPLPDSTEEMPTPGRAWGSLYAPTLPDKLINDGDVIQIGQRELQVVWTPGHTPGHCCFYLPQDKALIVGDHLLPKITPHVGVYPGGPENPLGDFINSLRKVQQLDVEVVLPAHGAVYKDHRYRAKQIIQHHEYRKQEMRDAILRQPKTAHQIAVEVFDSSNKLPFFHMIAATFETLAHLHLLLYEGKVKQLEEGDRIRFMAQ